MATVDFKKVPTDVPLTVENIDRISARATELAIAFKRRLESIQRQFSDARLRYSREADEVVSESDVENREVAKKFAKQQLASKIAKFRINIEKSSRPQREEILQPLAKLAADADFLLTLYGSPAQALGRVALGEVKRTQYQLQLEGAGPVELQTAAVTAIATNDLPLAAAVVTVVDRRKRDQRPFAANEFAQQMWGKQHDEVNAKLKGVIHAYKSAVAADREFARGKADPLTNLSLAISSKAIAQASKH